MIERREESPFKTGSGRAQHRRGAQETTVKRVKKREREGAQSKEEMCFQKNSAQSV